MSDDYAPTPEVTDRTLDSIEVSASKRGRKPSLEPDERTLALISGLAQIQCTRAEAAGVLRVHVNTLTRFLEEHEEAKEVWEDGQMTGRMSLRRKQNKLAERNAAMAIFLGKNYLDQTDRHEIGGPGGGAIPMRFENMTNAQLTSFLARLDAEIGAREGEGGAGPENPSED